MKDFDKFVHEVRDPQPSTDGIWGAVFAAALFLAMLYLGLACLGVW